MRMGRTLRHAWSVTGGRAERPHADPAGHAQMSTRRGDPDEEARNRIDSNDTPFRTVGRTGIRVIELDAACTVYRAMSD